MNNMNREIPNLVGTDLVGEMALLDTRAQMNIHSRRLWFGNNQNLPNELIIFGENLQNANLLSDENFRNAVLRKKILLRTSFSLMRVIFLMFAFAMDGYFINSSIEPLVMMLVIHETIVMLNFAAFAYSIIISRRIEIPLEQNQENNIDMSQFTSLTPGEIKRTVEKVDFTANIIFFLWFLYGNYVFLFQKDALAFTIDSNRYLAYYLTTLLLLGYFIYSRLIFAIIFFVIFLPCILFVFIDDYLEQEREKNRIIKVKESLEQESYEDYKKRHKLEVDACIICTEAFKPEDKVSGLRCNEKHCFHHECIDKWVDIRVKCPLCRADLDPDHVSDTHSQSNSNLFSIEN